ncbi:MAG: hypothetical protein AAGJ09_09640 [Pseudomonadota bacterium]
MMRYILVAALILLAGCSKTAEPPVAQAPLENTSGLALGPIAQQGLSLGQCGLALWTKTTGQTRLFYATDTPAEALISHNNAETVLQRVSQSGGLARGFPPQQRYRAGDMVLDVDVEIETRDGMLSGAVIRDGVISFRAQQDQETLVVPVVGIIGCK